MTLRRRKTEASGMASEAEVDHQVILAHLGKGNVSRTSVWNLVFVVEVAALLGLWEMISGPLGVMNPKFLPPPSAIFDELWRMLPIVGERPITEDIVFSLKNFGYGYVLAAVVGTTLGLVIGTTKSGELLLGPLAYYAYAVPRSALAPVIILIWGLGAESKVVIIFLLAVFPVLITTMEGGAQVDRTLVDAGRVFGATRLQIMRKVILPDLFPYVLIGLRIAVIRGYIGVLIGELMGSFKGLGTILKRSSYNFEMATSFAVVVILIVLSSLTMLLVSFMKTKLAPWHQEEDLLKSR
jgi:ABC-type nitrate/sulfonate/bicarbonate transport system permease component